MFLPAWKTMALTCQFVFLALIAKSAMCSFVVIVEPDPDSYVYSSHNKKYLPTTKRSGGLILDFTEVENVCKTKIIKGHRPHRGHIMNGSRVEIRQDDEYEFVATFVECEQADRPPCYGIDHKRFSSQCVTEFEHRPAYVRLVSASSSAPYIEGLVRVPIACQCEVRRVRSIFE